MKLVLTFVLSYLYLVQITNCKKFRLIVSDEILNYEIDKSVKHITDIFSLKNYMLEQIDDDNIELGGYLECIKSLDRNAPLQMIVETQTLEQGIWKDQAMKVSIGDACREFLNPERFWYNFTKLFTKDVCPPKQGFKWNIETQNCTALLNLQDSMPTGQWRAFILITQATPMGKTQFGIGYQGELVEV